MNTSGTPDGITVKPKTVRAFPSFQKLQLPWTVVHMVSTCHGVSCVERLHSICFISKASKSLLDLLILTLKTPTFFSRFHHSWEIAYKSVNKAAKNVL